MKHLRFRLIGFLVVALMLTMNILPTFSASKAKSYAATPTPSGLKLQFYNAVRSSTVDTIYPNFKLVNSGTSTISLTDIKLRYYYTIDGEKSQIFRSDWSTVGSANITGTFSKIYSSNLTANYYLEVGFKSEAGSLSPGKSVEVISRITKSDWSSFTQTNDYSFNATASTFVDWNKATIYAGGSLAWGIEPAFSPSPTPTSKPTNTPTPTPSPTNTPTPTPSPTNTPTPTPSPTNTPTPTPSPTNTPTPTPSPTNTPTPTPSPTNTPTPTPSPTNTPTPTPSPTNTPTPTPSPTNTPTPTPSPTDTPTPTPSPTNTPTPTPSPTATPTPTPLPTNTPTPTSIPAKQVLGFTTYYYSGDKSSYNSMVNNKASIDQIATATHITDGLGNITGLIPTEQITYANNNNITSLLMIGNNFDGNIAKTLLESAANRSSFIKNLLTILKANNYKGVNIDLEGVYASNRSHYTTFMSEVHSALKPLGYTVSVSVPAKTSDNPSNSWNGAYDYPALAKYVDTMLLMTYDEHYPGGSPGAVASINWVSNVLNYTLTVVPKEKVLLGLAAYGYDWSSIETKAYSVNGCYTLAAKYGAAILWDNTSKCPYFTYTDANGISHTVWFENAQSISYKLDLVNAKGNAGIGIWRLGLENIDYWNTIKQKLNR
ncbi:MAG: glycosyl hydrolase family 18 protein [Clostridia bacterium]|nr:glycosyl hydrolase family 18 protein [Clostridia bacterium]